ncbi:dynein regulatory complex subunit 3-like [Mya arenaria]|uniref:dynein regulatory complex subunit 3-like n=1 Tax=Mya arenaria TaxID=6604 RepID=UPI0022DECEAA|nr:dynein regulatory complex subunit 3-like [Mya arenaria]XP_052781902.1 dynein regulatory complex subunit 3-like [Mya arenaria]
MSRLYDTVEPSVIDEDMLQKAVEEQGPKDEAGKIAKSEGIDFADVTSLRLEFKNILEIDNMWSFENLTKLQLDNNIIEKIKGLDELVNLVWLDLSFNNIEMIEGLDKLTKLQDLTLYNNRISRIENMDKLTDLHVLSLGNNNLTDLENVIHLRRFRKLRTLNLAGNPFCEQAEYKQYVTAYVSSIDFLDYRLIDEQSRAAATERYHLSIEEMLHNERVADQKYEEEKKREVEEALYREGYVDGLDGPELFEGMYADDNEGKKMKEMPGVDDLMVTFREKFVGICKQIFDYGLQENSKRQEEVSQFWECVMEAKTENKDAGIGHINNFMNMKKRVFAEMNHITDSALLDQKVKEYNKEVTELWDKLMALELQLVDQFEEIIKEFERNLQDMGSTFIENVQGYLSQCRDLENNHHERMLEIAIVTLEKVVKNELDDEINDDLRNLFVDKDTIINAVTSSHDVHLLKIDNKEDDMVTRINGWMKNTIEKIHYEQEVKRNRERVAEINNLIDHLREEIENLEVLQGTGY